MVNACQRICTDVYKFSRIMLFVFKGNIQISLKNTFKTLIESCIKAHLDFK